MSSPDALRSEPRVLLSGLAYVESPRWHEDRLWLAHWGVGEIVAVDLDGASEVVGYGPTGFGWSIGWLPDGRLLVTGERLIRRERDGSMVQHADLSGLSGDWNEIVVDGRGNVYVNGRCDFEPAEGDPPGIIALVTPAGSVRQVADAIAFPNGMVVTPDNSTLIVAESFAGRLTAFDIAADGSLANRRVWADLSGAAPDGICLDADGAVWYADVPNQRCVRVGPGRERAGHGSGRPGVLRVHARRSGRADTGHPGRRMARHREGGRDPRRPDRSGAGRPGTGVAGRVAVRHRLTALRHPPRAGSGWQRAAYRAGAWCSEPSSPGWQLPMVGG
jgi:sugar lactone lactonase YvrE